MLRQFLNWRIGITVIAILIVSGTIIYTNYLSRKIAREEKQKVEQWYKAGKFIITSPPDADVGFASQILTENKTIPIIETTEKDSITQSVNLDAAKIAQSPSYLQNKLREFKSQQHEVFEWIDPTDSTRRNRYYYGDSKLLNEVRYYPIIQLCILALFITITLFSLRSSYRSVQNQVWVGMAKETAHQLGTPVSSLEGWVEMLKEKSTDEAIAHELEKDVNRLRLISDRFGKIGSKPQLEQVDLVKQINSVVDYMKKRAPGKIVFLVNTDTREQIKAKISPPLFDWVIENLLKNSLDAMADKGTITINIHESRNEIVIDICDTGKGISRKNISKVFKPGFTTKKRGWGLGLSLSRRIITQYHAGKLFVKHSELGVGSIFRIILKK